MIQIELRNYFNVYGRKLSDRIFRCIQSNLLKYITYRQFSISHPAHYFAPLKVVIFQHPYYWNPRSDKRLTYVGTHIWTACNETALPVQEVERKVQLVHDVSCTETSESLNKGLEQCETSSLSNWTWPKYSGTIEYTRLSQIYPGNSCWYLS